MYTSIKINLYCENWCPISNDIKAIFAKSGLPFKELHNSTLLFSAIKNPENIVVIVVSSPQLINQLESFVRNCYDYQNRIFIVYKDVLLDDKFFNNSCHYLETDILYNFLNSSAVSNLNKPIQPSRLLLRLVQLELEKLKIPTKYIGFKYLTQLAVNYLCNTYSSNTYIELFEYVASLNLASIDTIERDVRHMLITTWKNNEEFRQRLQRDTPLKKTNSKTILNAILLHLKSSI